uniref:Uncharacterized protein MANES_18G043400 n=1 Tax=Rhizophora mucronata TaxID=61149 RepID=A0A2P2KYW7_RHIMU
MNMFLPLSLARSLWHQSTNRSNVQASSIASSNVFSATPRLLWTIAISFSHMDMWHVILPSSIAISPVNEPLQSEKQLGFSILLLQFR